MRLLHKVETYNSDTAETHIMDQDTVGTYKSSGAAANSIQGKTYGGEVSENHTRRSVHTALLTLHECYIALRGLSCCVVACSACASGVAPRSL